MEPALKASIEHRLAQEFAGFGEASFHSVGGGSINQTYRIAAARQQVFCKVNRAADFPELFQNEVKGLQLLAAPKVLLTPKVIDCFVHGSHQVLLLDWIEEGPRTEAFWTRFGEGLAALHHASAPEFGLSHDNYMGSVPQQNQQHATWIDFFFWQRLTPLVDRCRKKGFLNDAHRTKFETLYNRLPHLFEPEPPSLVHGDLWSGNFLCNRQSQPVLIDPAAHYGHRAADLGMTTLFGGFHSRFYEAYHHHFPLPPNHREQWEVCNLYPLLVHLYLFGFGYLPAIERSLQRFA